MRTHARPRAPSFRVNPDPNYLQLLALRIADAVQQGVTNLVPARIGWGVGKDDRQVFNRRWKMKPGTIPADPFGRTTDQVKMNPPVASPNLIEPAGPVDPEVSVVAVQSSDGRPLALLSNYSLHYVGGVGRNHVSADYFGDFALRVEVLLQAERFDPPFVAMMTNGTSGDINNVNFRAPRRPAPPYEQIRLVAADLAQEASRVAQAIGYHDRAPLNARATDLMLGVRLPSPEEVARAEALVGQAKGSDLKTVEEVYARETLLLSKYPREVPVTVQTLRGTHRDRGDPLRGVRRDRPGAQGQEPAEADVHDRAGQRLQRLPAHQGGAPRWAVTKPGGRGRATSRSTPRPGSRKRRGASPRAEGGRAVVLSAWRLAGFSPADEREPARDAPGHPTDPTRPFLSLHRAHKSRHLHRFHTETKYRRFAMTRVDTGVGRGRRLGAVACGA